MKPQSERKEIFESGQDGFVSHKKVTASRKENAIKSLLSMKSVSGGMKQIRCLSIVTNTIILWQEKSSNDK